MSKPRINANVAKLEIGRVYRWSETNIGAVALDNAIAGGHLIYVEMGDATEYSVMRPTEADRQNMIPTVNQFGTTVYGFPTAAAQNEAQSQKGTDTMTAETTTTTTAQQPAVSFDQLVEQVTAAHHLARQLGLDWKEIMTASAAAYKATKPVAEATTKAPKAAKAPSAPRGEQYTIVTPTPNGEITHLRGKPYTHAAIIHTAAGWEVYALVSSKDTAKKRLGDARRTGLAFDAHDVVETRLAHYTPDAEAEQVEVEVEQPLAPTPEQRRAAIATTLDAGALPTLVAQPQPAEIVREAEVDEPLHVQIAGKASRGTMVHYSDDGLDTYCGCGPDRDYRQVQDAVTCSKCQKIAAARATKAS